MRQPTDDNIWKHGLAPAMRCLVAAALDKTSVTYGNLTRRVESEAGFSKIHSGSMGHIPGSLMNRLHQVDENAPLINVLAVNQVTREPSEGAGSFMARRFNQPCLGNKGFKDKHPSAWTKAFDRAAGEVYAYSFDEWADLYHRTFGRALSKSSIDRRRRERRSGREKDGLPRGRRGEGDNHRALRLWTKANPGRINRRFAEYLTATEVDLDSGDRVDVVYSSPEETIVLEVKSRDSNWADLNRGVYQCIKYRAVQEAMDVREGATIIPYLVTEIDLPGDIRDLLALHDIRHFKAPE